MPAPTEHRRRILTLTATILGSSLAFLDATVVVVALPTMSRDLDFGLAGQQWVLLSYSLALAALYLPAGAVGDRWGRRRTFSVGVIGFAAASAFAGAAPNEAALIAARALQGVAGAFLTTSSLALLRATYGNEAGRAIGLWTAFTGAANILGPPAGGALVEWVSWRWIFFVNLPLAAGAIALAVAGRCEERAQLRAGHLDVPGAALAAVGFGALTYGLVEGAERGFGEVWWALALAALALSAFVAVELRSREPILPPELFSTRNLAVANLETFLVYAALSAFFIFLILYLQFLGFTAFEAGLTAIPGSAFLLLLAPRFGTLADRHGPRLYLAAGPAAMAAGALLFVPVDERSDFWTFGLGGLLLFSLGLAAMVPVITTTAIAAAPERLAGIASGVNSTVSRLGGLVAVAAVGLLVAVVFERSGGGERAEPLAAGQQDPEAREASTDAFRGAMLAAAGLALAGALVAAAGISNAEAKQVSRREPAPAEI